MKFTDIQRKIVSAFSDRQLLVNLSFYLAAAAAIWHFYDLKVLGILTLFLVNIFVLSKFLTKLYFTFNQEFKKLNLRIVVSSLLILITFYLAYKFWDKITFGYISVLSLVIAVISISRR